MDGSKTTNAFSVGVYIRNYLQREVLKDGIFIIKDIWDKPFNIQVSFQNDTNGFPQIIVKNGLVVVYQSQLNMYDSALPIGTLNNENKNWTRSDYSVLSGILSNFQG